MHVWPSLSLSLTLSHSAALYIYCGSRVCSCGWGSSGRRGEGGGHSKVPVMAGETRKPTVQTVRATWPQVLSCLSCLLCSAPPPSALLLSP